MNKAVTKLLCLSLAFVLGACQPSPSSNEGDASSQGDLVGAAIGGDFALTGADGRTVRWADFAGKYRLVYFGYTYCPDVCPLDLSRIMAGYRLLEKSDPPRAAKIVPIFITVDPARDTPAVVKTYTAAFHPKLVGLTGTPEQIEDVKKKFVVVAGKEGDPAETKNYLVNHTRTPFLFGPDGKPIALVPVETVGAQEESSATAVRDFLAKFVR